MGVGFGAGGWLVFSVPYDALARGENLLGIGASGRELRVEKVEVRVCCAEVFLIEQKPRGANRSARLCDGGQSQI